MEKKLRIAVWNDITHQPYLKSLYTNLKKCKGVKVETLMPSSQLSIISVSLKADIVHLHWIEYFMLSYTYGLLASVIKFFSFLTFVIILKIFRKRIVITLHNVQPHEIISQTLIKTGFRLSLKMADAIIVHNHFSKKAICRLYKICGKAAQKVIVIPHGNFIGFYENKVSKSKAREILKIDKDKFVLLYLGRIRKYKGIELLLEAFKKAITVENNIFLMICGNPDEISLVKKLNTVKNEIKYNIFIHPKYIPEGDLQIYMNAADVGILPYTQVTTSGSVLLFSSFRKPVIVPNISVIKEAIGNSAIYFKKGDINSLTEAILLAKQMKGNGVLNKIADAVYNKVLSKYSWQKIAEDTLALYLSLLSK